MYSENGNTAPMVKGRRRVFQTSFPPAIFPYLLTKNIMWKTTAAWDFLRFSRKNKFFSLIGKTSSCAHCETHYRHVVWWERICVPRCKPLPILFFSRFSVGAIAWSERANERTSEPSRNKSRCCRDSSWTSRVENWTASPCFMTTFLAFNIQ